MMDKWKAWGDALVDLIQPIMTALASPVRAWLVAIGNAQLAAWAFVAIFFPVVTFTALEVTGVIDTWNNHIATVDRHNAAVADKIEISNKEARDRLGAAAKPATPEWKLATFTGTAEGLSINTVVYAGAEKLRFQWRRSVGRTTTNRLVEVDLPVVTGESEVRTIVIPAVQFGNAWTPEANISLRNVMQVGQNNFRTVYRGGKSYFRVP